MYDSISLLADRLGKLYCKCAEMRRLFYAMVLFACEDFLIIKMTTYALHQSDHVFLQMRRVRNVLLLCVLSFNPCHIHDAGTTSDVTCVTQDTSHQFIRERWSVTYFYLNQTSR